MDLGRIEARLRDLEELGELVGAMRSMAATRAREAQDAFAGTRAYCATVERAIARTAPLADAPAAPDGGRAPVLVAIGSEQGFVGGFNARMVDRVLAERQPEETLVMVGRRGVLALQERQGTADMTFAMTGRIAGVPALADRIAAGIADARSVRILSARYRSGAGFEIETRRILPLAPTLPDPPPDPPLCQLPPGQLLADLATEYLFAEIAAALMESLASENGARLRTMDAASRSIGDRLETLRRDARSARQERTTAEMLEVVVGAEAAGWRRPVV